MLPPSFLQAYQQVSLSAKMGGHGLREWGRHIDQAFVGQWCLTVQSATRPRQAGQPQLTGSARLFYPVLQDVLDEAAARNTALTAEANSEHNSVLPRCTAMAADVGDAWLSCVAESRTAID